MFHHLVLMRMRMVVRFALGRQDKIWVAKTATKNRCKTAGFREVFESC